MPIVFRSNHIEELTSELAELESRAGLIRRVLDGYKAQEELRLMVGAAEPQADDDEVAEDEPMTDAVEKLVRDSASPLTPGVIRTVLMQNPRHAPRLERSPTYLYSVLFRLTKQARLRKIGDRYAAPKVANEMHP